MTSVEIDDTVRTLRESPGRRWTSRGRGGHGLQFRDDRFWSISIDDRDEWSQPFTDEDELRSWLATLDVAEGNRTNRYYRAILCTMGTM